MKIKNIELMKYGYKIFLFFFLLYFIFKRKYKMLIDIRKKFMRNKIKLKKGCFNY